MTDLDEDGRCVRSGLLPDQCAHCTGALAAETARAGAEAAGRRRFLDSGRSLPARYAGRCSGCGEPFEVGDLIGPDTASDGWLGPCCLPSGIPGRP